MKQRGTWSCLILAAGKGTRMKSSLPKVLHQVAGRPMVDWVVSTARKALGENAQLVAVVGHERKRVARYLEALEVEHVVQEPQLGTGHAVARALDSGKIRGEFLMVLCGDTPLVTPASLRALREKVEEGAAASVLVAELERPGAYGRVLLGPNRRVRAVVEASDAPPEVLAIGVVNAGQYAFRVEGLTEMLRLLDNDNAKGEYYLTDLFKLLWERGTPAAAVKLDDPLEMLGVNTKEELAEAAKVLVMRHMQHLMREGATIIDPRTTWVEPGCFIGRDAVIEPCCVIRGGTVVGEGARVGAGSVLDGVRIAPGEEVPPVSWRRGDACD